MQASTTAIFTSSILSRPISIHSPRAAPCAVAAISISGATGMVRCTSRRSTDDISLWQSPLGALERQERANRCEEERRNLTRPRSENEGGRFGEKQRHDCAGRANRGDERSRERRVKGRAQRRRGDSRRGARRHSLDSALAEHLVPCLLYTSPSPRD